MRFIDKKWHKEERDYKVTYVNNIITLGRVI